MALRHGAQSPFRLAGQSARFSPRQVRRPMIWRGPMLGRVRRVLRDRRGHKEIKVSKASREYRARRGLKVLSVRAARWVRMVRRALRVRWVGLAHRASTAFRARKVIL